jgi:hypothetical protein
MRHRSPRLQALLAAAAASLVLACAPAHAKRGLAIINTGDELFEVAEMPAEVVAAHPQSKGVKAGYKCSHFGIFWADVWTWDCKLVAVLGENSYADLPPEVAGQLAANSQFTFSNAKRGLWNHYAVPALLGGLVLLLLVGAVGGRKQQA